jgi:biotin operon repressor
MGRPALYPVWADKVLDVLLDLYAAGKRGSIRHLTRNTGLTTPQVRRGIQHLRTEGIAVMERNGRYWLSADALEQLWYSAKRAKDMVSRAETSVGTVQKQDRHVDRKFLAPLRRRFAFIRDELDEMLPMIREEIAKKRNHGG